MRLHVVREKHWLSSLHVGVTREIDRQVVVSNFTKRVDEVKHDRSRVVDRVTRKQTQRGGDLIVATPSGVQLCAHRASNFSDPTLDRRVDVFIALPTNELTAGELTLDGLERFEEHSPFGFVQYAGSNKPLYVGP